MIYKCKLWAVLLSLICGAAHAQKMSREEVVQAAIKNNGRVRAAEHETEQARHLKKAQADPGNFSVVLMRGQYNTIEQDNNFTLTQSLPFPTTWAAQSKLGKEQWASATRQLAVTRNELAWEAKVAYEELLFYTAMQQLLLSQDSLFTDFARAANARYKVGEGTLLEKTTAESQLLETKNQLQQNQADLNIMQTRLQLLTQSASPVLPAETFQRRVVAMGALTNNPSLLLANQQMTTSRAALRVERHRFLPNLELGYFNQTLIGFQNTRGTENFYNKDTRFQGFLLGLSFPLWFGPQVARAKASLAQYEAARTRAEYSLAAVNQAYEEAQREWQKNEASLSFYESTALHNAALILLQAQKSFKAGEIGYVEYLQSLQTALQIRRQYLNALLQYNMSVNKIEHLTGSN